MKQISLSKTSYLEGLRCPKLLWLRINQPALAEPLDAQTVYLFETGHRVEVFARQLFRGGALIGNGGNRPFSALVADTQRAIESNVPYIYEASFSSGNRHCRTDILHRGSADQWNLGEIKMCTKVKPEHTDDVAFQVSCLESAGHRVARTHLIHVNKSYTRKGEIDPVQFIVSADISQEVSAELPNIQAKVAGLLKVVQQQEPPSTIVGSHCSSPGKCPYYHHCHGPIPSGSIFELPYGSKLIPLLLEKGIFSLVNIPRDVPLTKRQAVLVKSAKEGRPIIDKVALREFLKQLRPPIAFLDFETIAGCIPNFDNLSPYEKLPFQFSIHIETPSRSELRHHEYLAESSADPREEIVKQLIDFLGNSGTIISWNMSFEKSVLTNLAIRFPQYAERINALLARFCDLIVPFRTGIYADARAGGSASLKAILPVMVASLSYSRLAINHGDVASLMYQKYIDNQISAVEWSALRSDMLAYCSLDTYAMTAILKVLRSAI